MASAFNPQSVIADIGVEGPDFGMLSKAAVSVQNRYLEGFNRYKSILTSGLNADITSDDNIKFRNEYFKKIDGYLNNIGGIDFSNPANVAVANSLMDPLIKDPDFLADYNTTMMQKAERKKLESVKLSTDEKVRSQYSADLEQAMNYTYTDLKNAKRGDGSIGRVGVQRYIPFTNLQKVLDEAAIALKLTMKPDPIVTDKWIITDSFGNNAIPALTQWARQQLGSNYDEQLMVTAKVNVRRQMDAIMGANPNITKEDAYQQVAKNMSVGIFKNYEEYKNSLIGGVSAIDRQIADIKSRLNNRIAKGSQEEQYIASLKKMKQEYEREIADGKNGNLTKDQELQNAFEQFMQNPEYALLPMYKDNITKGWAQSYASTHAERDIKVNEYGLEAVRFANDKELKKMQFEHDALMKQMDFANSLELELFKKDLAAGGISEAPGQITTVDPFIDYVNETKENQQTIYEGYFDRSVLEVATSSSNLAADVAPYDQLRGSLETFFEMYSVYGNQYAANPEYNKAARQVVNLIRKISPGFTIDQAMNLKPADVMTIIQSGVMNRYGGSKDPNTKEGARFAEARTRLFNAQSAQESFGDRYQKMIEDYEQLPIEMKQKFDTDAWKKYGVLKLRTGVSQSDKEAIYSRIFPGWEAQQARSVTGVSSPNVEEDKFDYTALNELFGSADYATDGVDEPNDAVLTKDHADLNAKLRAAFMGGGSDMKQYFGSKFDAYKVVLNGREYMKVQLSTKTTTDGENRLAEKGVSSGAIALYIPREKAESLWQGTKTLQTSLGTRTVSKYGPLADIPKKLFTQSNAVRWLTSGLTGEMGKSYFPASISTQYDIDGGYVAFSGKQSKSPVMVVVQKGGKTYEEYITLPNGKPLDRATYSSDPVKFSNDIDRIIRLQLEKFRVTMNNKYTSDRLLHESNYMQNPDNFMSVDDINVA